VNRDLAGIASFLGNYITATDRIVEILNDNDSKLFFVELGFWMSLYKLEA
jgi:hypothetical protein